jgi:glycosyltransferase involved in cell wall biosynthesis
MKIKLTHPPVSCICITGHRPQQLLKAIIGFDAQNYPNKELIISYPKSDEESKDLLTKVLQFSKLRIVTIEHDNDLSIGQAKNQAIQRSSAEYICIWDDEAIYHYDRILHQYNDMLVKHYQAGVLARVFIYDAIHLRSYHSVPYDWGNSLICRKDILFSHPYEDENRLEDRHLFNFLTKDNFLNQIYDSAYLYTIIIDNTHRLEQHNFNFLLRQSEILDEQSNQYLKQQFEHQYQLV